MSNKKQQHTFLGPIAPLENSANHSSCSQYSLEALWVWGDGLVGKVLAPQALGHEFDS